LFTLKSSEHKAQGFKISLVLSKHTLNIGASKARSHTYRKEAENYMLYRIIKNKHRKEIGT